ncbi:hypothetical protein KSP39_PZI002392 [Platanthera zijinensis]|uniref:Uncharacterized protein n=1 Tax=Platanthera zijinensis TaxID=2320716 RepID=A0AAP0GE36_9ASPA
MNLILIDTIVQKEGIKPQTCPLRLVPINLAKKLLEVFKYVVSIELDPHMILKLNRHFHGTPYSNRLKVILYLHQSSLMKCGLAKARCINLSW